MDQSASMLRVQATRAADFAADEPLIGAMSATLPKGDAALDPNRMAAASGFPLANKMMLALTPRRVVVYRTGWGGKVSARIGELEQNRIANIEITWNRKLAVVAFALADAPAVVMIASDTASAEHFRNRFLRLRGRI